MREKHMCFDTNSKLLSQGSSLKNYKAQKKAGFIKSNCIISNTWKTINTVYSKVALGEVIAAAQEGKAKGCSVIIRLGTKLFFP